MLTSQTEGLSLLAIYAVLVILTLHYALVSILLFIGVSRLKKKTAANIASDRTEKAVKLPFVSILVAARDEERCVADCLESLVQQKYPSDRYEIVIVNDRSVDTTPDIIEGYQKKHDMVKCVNISSNPSGLTGKQNAINEGLKFCAGEIILNTDADCIARPLWVRRTVSYFTPQISLAIGFATTHNANGTRSFFSALQSLDMLFLIDAASGAIGMNVPVSGLGWNLAYRKAILNDISYLKIGYTITEDAALVQAVARNTDSGITVLYNEEASVSTLAEQSLKRFLSQRIRWMVGGQSTKTWSQIPLHVIFLFNLCLAVSLPLMFFIRPLIAIVSISVLVKILLDFARCWRVCREFRKSALLSLLIPYEIFLISYSIFTGFASIFIRKIKWKGDVYAK